MARAVGSKNREINQWLRTETKLARHWTLVSTISGALLAVLLVIQAAQIAQIINGVAFEDAKMADLVQPMFILAFAILGRAIAVYVREWAGQKASVVVRRELRRQFLTKLNRLGPGYTAGQRTGDLVSRVFDQIEALDGFIARYLPQAQLCVIMPLVIFFAVLPLNWACAVILFATAPLIPLFMALVGIKAADANRRNFQALANLGAHFLDVVQGLPTLKLFEKTADEEKHLAHVSERFRERTMEVLRLAFLSSAVLEFFASVSIAVLAVYLGFTFLGELHFGQWDGSVSLYDALFVLVLAPEFYLPLRDLGTHYHAKQQAVAAGEKLMELAAEPEVWESAEGGETVDAPIHIDFSAVTARYPDADKDVLSELQLTVEPNQVVAIAGPSGAGKSTLMNLLLGFMTPVKGEMRINGKALSQLDRESWLQQVAWVSQKTALFRGTLRENLLLANPAADEQQLKIACDQAHVTEFLERLPKGLETEIGENGAGLSGGQIQRIGLARAFLKDAPVLLLDEPTANLDARSEALVLDALEVLRQGKTTLMLTHRLQTMVRADQLWLLEAGQLVAASVDIECGELKRNEVLS